jgi:uncharacterized membrane protein YraQ (UPF0718 family)
MVAVLLIPLVAVTLGAVLSVIGGTRPRVLLPIRAFALAAVVTAVSIHLVPEALATAGPWSLLAFAFGLWLPLWLGHLRRDMAERGRHRRIASELGFVAVLLHQVGDGVALGALGTSAGDARANWDVLVGIFAHTVPLAAVVTLPFAARGLRSVAVRAAVLIAATIVGVLGTGALAAVHAEILPWLSAGVAGTLLHILAHDEPALARPAGLRRVEVAALLAGAALPALLAHEEERVILAQLGASLLELAPVLALGLGATVLLRARLPDATGAKLRSRGVLRGFVAALRSPSCACEVTAHAGAGPAPTRSQLAFLLSAPELHVGTLLLTGWLFGGWWALARALAAMAVAAAAVALMGRAAPTVALGPAPPGDDVATWTRLSLRDQLAETFVHAGPWLAAGLVVATWLAALPAGALLGADPGRWDGAGGALLLPSLVTAIATLTYVCAWAATPVAAVLVGHGLPPYLAILGLLLGTITNREVVRVLTARLGRRAVLALALVVVVLTATATLALRSGALHPGLWPGALTGWQLPRALQWLGAALLVGGTLLSLWRYGLTAWLEPLLADASGHRHHQHDEAAPCQDGCHDVAAPADGLATQRAGAQGRGQVHRHDHHHGHVHRHEHEHEHEHDSAEPAGRERAIESPLP